MIPRKSDLDEIRKRVEEICYEDEACIEEGIRGELDHPNGISLEEQRMMDEYVDEASKEFE